MTTDHSRRYHISKTKVDQLLALPQHGLNLLYHQLPNRDILIIPIIDGGVEIDMDLSSIQGNLNATSSRARLRVCGVTAIFGHYEATLKEPTDQTLPLKLFAFTDRKDQLLSTKYWTVIDFLETPIFGSSSCGNNTDINSPCNNTNRFNLGKYYKMQAHQIPVIKYNCDVVIWFDCTVQIVNTRFVEMVSEILLQGHNILVFEHHERGGYMSAEGDASVLTGRYHSTRAYNMDQPFQNTTAQLEHWQKEGFTEHWWKLDAKTKDLKLSAKFGMWVTCMVVFNLRAPETEQFLNLWWYENRRHTTQDQMTFAYVVWKTRVIPYSLPQGTIQGNSDYNNLYKKHPHGL